MTGYRIVVQYDYEMGWTGPYFYWPIHWAPPAPGVIHKADDFSPNMRLRCAPGVHFFPTLEDAERFSTEQCTFEAVIEIWEVESIGAVVCSECFFDGVEGRKARAEAVRYIQRMSTRYQKPIEEVE